MKMNRFFGMVIAGIVAVSSLACGGEDNEDGEEDRIEEDRIVVYNTPDGEYLYDKKFKFFGKWSEVETNDEERYRIMRFVPDTLSRTDGVSSYYYYYYFDQRCSFSEGILMGSTTISMPVLFDGELEKLSEYNEPKFYKDYVEWDERLKWYDFLNIGNKNREIVNFPYDKKYCYFIGNKERIDYYVIDRDGKCVKYENEHASTIGLNMTFTNTISGAVYPGSVFRIVLWDASKDIECFSYDDLVERKETLHY